MVQGKKLKTYYLFRCKDTSEFTKYTDLNRKLYHGDENDVFELTGCLSSCDKFEYVASPLTDLRIMETPWKSNENTLQISFFFTTGRHDVREQVGKVS